MNKKQKKSKSVSAKGTKRGSVVEGSLADAVIDLVQQRPGASFPEVQRVLGEAGYDTMGDFSLEKTGTNYVFWVGLSAELADVLIELRRSRRIHMHMLASMEARLIYMLDGAVIEMPMISARPPASYKKPHWVPVVYYVGGQCTAKNCIDKFQESSAKGNKKGSK